MTALDATADNTPQPGTHVEEVVEAVTVAVPGPLGGDPAILGLPSIIVGSVAASAVYDFKICPTFKWSINYILLAKAFDIGSETNNKEDKKITFMHTRRIIVNAVTDFF